MMNEAKNAAVAWLVARRRARQSVADWPSALKPATEDEGYAVQAAALGPLDLGAQVGWKIGVTTPQMRAHLGIASPIGGAMVEGLWRASGDTIRAAEYCRIGIECEIAFVLKAPLGGAGPVDVGMAAQAVGTAHPAIEIVDDRYGGDYARVGVPAIIADFAFHAGFVLGAPVANWTTLDLAAVRGVTRANGRVMGEGRGADVQGHPLASLAWLTNRIGAFGRRLEPGQIVLTGSLPLPYWGRAGDRVDIEIEGLGGLTLSIA